ncbi:hypothetical protein FKR81_41755 [Lentzea tibetensis]|uniref:ADP ribosyltransferase domain-containing protein n=1 Tax=Lentzea tibetensis TaxID=2591470 RepID=A0A563EF18_9PSEU|nr:ADP-ribosyltransferase [Lentzea tibetensis]TWP44017.1 hypothetical protein FKR81_41755 [Lentzea tibetensis]
MPSHAEIPFGFHTLLRDPMWKKHSEGFEKDLRNYLFDQPEVRNAAQATLRKLRDVLAARYPDEPEKVASAFGSAVVTSAGQVGSIKSMHKLNDLIDTANTRVLMTTLYNALYFNNNEVSLKRVIQDYVKGELSEEDIEEFGLNTAALTQHKNYMNGQTRKWAEVALRVMFPHRAYIFGDDPFALGNLITRGGDAVELTLSQYNREQPSEQDRRTSPHTRSFQELNREGIGLDRHEYRLIGNTLELDGLLEKELSPNEVTFSINGTPVTATNDLDALQVVAFDKAGHRIDRVNREGNSIVSVEVQTPDGPMSKPAADAFPVSRAVKFVTGPVYAEEVFRSQLQPINDVTPQGPELPLPYLEVTNALHEKELTSSDIKFVNDKPELRIDDPDLLELVVLDKNGNRLEKLVPNEQDEVVAAVILPANPVRKLGEPLRATLKEVPIDDVLPLSKIVKITSGPGRIENVRLTDLPNHSWGDKPHIGPEVPLPWETGRSVFNLDQQSSWYRSKNVASGMPLISGISGTTTRMMTAFRWLAVPGVNTVDFLKSNMAWMLHEDHSLYEILRGAQMADSLPSKSDKEMLIDDAVEMYKSLDDLSPGLIRKLRRKDILLPHEAAYLEKANRPFTEGGLAHPTYEELAETASAIADLTAVESDTTPLSHRYTMRLQLFEEWLTRNNITASDALGKLGPAQLAAVRIYTGNNVHDLMNLALQLRSFPLSNAMNSAFSRRLKEKLDQHIDEPRNPQWVIEAHPSMQAACAKLRDLKAEAAKIEERKTSAKKSRDELKTKVENSVDAATEDERRSNEQNLQRCQGLLDTLDDQLENVKSSSVRTREEACQILDDLTPQIVAEMQLHADMLVETLHKLPKLSDVTVYRGDWKLGALSGPASALSNLSLTYGRSTIHFNDFSSTSLDSNVAMTFVAVQDKMIGTLQHPVLIALQLKGGHGVEIGPLSASSGEREVLLLPGATAKLGETGRIKNVGELYYEEINAVEVPVSRSEGSTSKSWLSLPPPPPVSDQLERDVDLVGGWLKLMRQDSLNPTGAYNAVMTGLEIHLGKLLAQDKSILQKRVNLEREDQSEYSTHLNDVATSKQWLKELNAARKTADTASAVSEAQEAQRRNDETKNTLTAAQGRLQMRRETVVSSPRVVGVRSYVDGGLRGGRLVMEKLSDGQRIQLGRHASIRELNVQARSGDVAVLAELEVRARKLYAEIRARSDVDELPPGALDLLDDLSPAQMNQLLYEFEVPAIERELQSVTRKLDLVAADEVQKQPRALGARSAGSLSVKQARSGEVQLDELVSRLPAMSPMERAAALESLHGNRQNILMGKPELVEQLRRTLSAEVFAQTAAQLIVRSSGDSDQPVTARHAAEAQVALMLGSNPKIAERLLNKGVQVVLIPEDTQLTSLKEFRHLDGQQITPRHGTWNQARGSGGTVHVAVGAENLTGGTTSVDRAPHYDDGYSVLIHEFAHTINKNGLPDEDLLVLHEAFRQKWDKVNLGEQVQWPDGPTFGASPTHPNYSATNVEEYFAQLTNAYYGANAGRDPYTGHVRNNGKNYVETHESPQVMDLLKRIYGTHPSPVIANPVRQTKLDNDMWKGFRDFQTAHADRTPSSSTATSTTASPKLQPTTFTTSDDGFLDVSTAAHLKSLGHTPTNHTQKHPQPTNLTFPPEGLNTGTPRKPMNR